MSPVRCLPKTGRRTRPTSARSAAMPFTALIAPPMAASWRWAAASRSSLSTCSKRLGREDLAPLHARGPGPHQQPLVDFLNAIFAEKELSEWEAILADIDVCWAPVLDLKEAFDQPQVQFRSMRWQDAEGNDHIGVPIRFADEPAQPSPDLPRLGQHNREVLLASGLPAETIDALQKSGVLISGH